MAKKFFLSIGFLALIGLALVSGENYNQNDKDRLEKKLNRLRSEDNEIDHGPNYKLNSNSKYEKMSNKKKQVLFGHQGEHWSDFKRGQSNYMSLKAKHVQENLKSFHNDDARLQDLAFEPEIRREQKRVRKIKGKKNKNARNGKKNVQKSEKLKKSMKKEIRRAMKKGMSLKQIEKKFAKEKKYPEKLYKKHLVKKFEHKKKKMGEEKKKYNNEIIP